MAKKEIESVNKSLPKVEDLSSFTNEELASFTEKLQKDFNRVGCEAGHKEETELNAFRIFIRQIIDGAIERFIGKLDNVVFVEMEAMLSASIYGWARKLVDLQIELLMIKNESGQINDKEEFLKYFNEQLNNIREQVYLQILYTSQMLKVKKEIYKEIYLSQRNEADKLSNVVEKLSRSVSEYKKQAKPRLMEFTDPPGYHKRLLAFKLLTYLELVDPKKKRSHTFQAKDKVFTYVEIDDPNTYKDWKKRNGKDLQEKKDKLNQGDLERLEKTWDEILRRTKEKITPLGEYLKTIGGEYKPLN